MSAIQLRHCQQERGRQSGLCVRLFLGRHEYPGHDWCLSRRVQAGAAFAGVPFWLFCPGQYATAWAGARPVPTAKWTMTGAQWGDLVRAAYPGYHRPTSRIQLWHGSVDTTVAFHNFGEAIKQWTNVLGVSETPTSTENDALPNWMDPGPAMPTARAWSRSSHSGNRKRARRSFCRSRSRRGHSFSGLDGSNPVPDGGTVTVKDSSVADTASRMPHQDGSGGKHGWIHRHGRQQGDRRRWGYRRGHDFRWSHNLRRSRRHGRLQLPRQERPTAA